MRIILHSDLNNFYASVEELKNPDLKGKPIIVVGNKEDRHGIVLAKNMLAKLEKCKNMTSMHHNKFTLKNFNFGSSEKHVSFSGLGG